MAISTGLLIRGTAWTIGSYAVTQAVRLGTNVVLARLLAPQLFGTMLIVDTMRIGVELISDVGISQNIIYHRNSDDPAFYNTAWSVQLVRSIILWLLFLAAAIPIARFYENPIFASVLPITAFNFLVTGFASIKRPLLQKRLGIAKINVFEMVLTCISSGSFILFAYFNPTIWALVFGGFVPSLASTIGSYFLLSGVNQRFQISKEAVWQILSFGKWIFVSSIIFFLSMNYDRLYLAKVIPLELVGIYGISRAISDVASNMVARLAAIVLFPFIASHADTPRFDLRKQLAPLRAKFMFVAALGFSLFVASADLAIKMLYDKRYEDATWVLPTLLIGTWFSILSNLSESTLLGLGKPSYSAISSGSRFGFLLLGFWFFGTTYGFVGCVLIITLSDLSRYLPSLIGQKREHFWFGSQDLFFTMLVVLIAGLLEWLRWLYGLGTSFDSMPLVRSYF